MGIPPITTWREKLPVLTQPGTAMEFRGKRRGKVESQYPTMIQLYKMPPVQTISLQEFEELALQRLKLLQEIDRIRQRSNREDSGGTPEIRKAAYQNKIKEALKMMPLSTVDDKGLEVKHVEERRKDHISHYILRLAYCRTEEMRRWFLSQETEILRYRFLLANHRDREDFFLVYKDDFKFELVTVPYIKDGSKAAVQLSKELYSFCKLTQVVDIHGDPIEKNQSFYKIPFTAAPELVQKRLAVVKNGFIYLVPNSEDIVSLLCSKFRSRLSEELTKTLNHLAVVDDDERISPLLKTLKHRYLGEDFSFAGTQFEGHIKLGQIDSFSKESFPPCMRYLHESLRKDHHLRHFSRLQYGLFLKSIGLTLDQALSFWRAEFVKKMEPDKFDKQYAYSIRHNYGKEGKRANYSAYSCMKIITTNAPGQGDHHGCPFRHWDEEHVRRMLTTHGVPHKGVNDIVYYVQNSHYQLACQKYFEITHALSTSQFSLEHPTQYYLESRRVRGGPVTASGTNVKQEPRSSVQPASSHNDRQTKHQEEEFKDEFGDLSAQDLEGFVDPMDTS